MLRVYRRGLALPAHNRFQEEIFQWIEATRAPGIDRTRLEGYFTHSGHRLWGCGEWLRRKESAQLVPEVSTRTRVGAYSCATVTGLIRFRTV